MSACFHAASAAKKKTENYAINERTLEGCVNRSIVRKSEVNPIYALNCVGCALEGLGAIGLERLNNSFNSEQASTPKGTGIHNARQ